MCSTRGLQWYVTSFSLTRASAMGDRIRHHYKIITLNFDVVPDSVSDSAYGVIIFFPVPRRSTR
jgi:hypothetical protein